MKKTNDNLIKNILLILCIVVSIPISAQTISNSFTHFTELDGLPSNRTGAIIQDHLGYIWIATINGLSRYDGYEFYNFNVVKNDTNFLQFPLISALYEDSRGDIWIGAVGGVSKYNRRNETFKNYYPDLNEKDKAHEYMITDISESFNGDMIFTLSGYEYNPINEGIYVLEKDSDIIKPAINKYTNTLVQITHIIDDRYFVNGFAGFAEYDHTKKTLNWFPLMNHWAVTALTFDDADHLWVGVYNAGLVHYSLLDSSYTNYPIVSVDTETDFFVITKIIRDQGNNLLIASNKGLFKFNIETKTIETAEVDALNPTAMHSRDLEGMMIDYSGSVWITTRDAGISKLDNSRRNFHGYSYNPNNPERISVGWIRSLFEQSENQIWFQSSSGKLSIFDPERDEIKSIKISVEGSINTIFKDKNKQIWLGGDNGIFKIEPESFSIEEYNISDVLKHSGIFTIFEDSEGIFWIGSYSGIFTINMKNSSVANIRFSLLGLGTNASDGVHKFVEDNNKNIWIATDDGLFRYSIIDRQFSRIGSSADPNKSFNSQDINSLYIDSYGKIWVGTWLGGLSVYDPVSKEIESYSQSEGLKSHAVQGILGDEANNTLWLSTFDGISRFDLKEKTFSNFSLADGVHSNQFADGVSLKTSNGNFIFGGQNGFTLFKPEEIKSNLVPPKIFLTEFKLFNETVKPNENTILSEPIYDTDEIILNYNENDITIDFLAVHYVEPKKNQYAYRLINYNDNWRYVGSQRTAIYPNLPPGDYTFQVKAANNNNIWNEEPRSLSIVIKTPPWATWWAYSIYLLAVIGFLYFVRKIEISRQQKNSEIKESKLRAEAAELQARAIQAENDRKSAELEEARQLQLSMLPKELPELPHLDIAVYMQTATEVGGDYYDFHIGMDGTLTVVLGDATGHGMKAGTMVTSVKSLFNVLAPNADIMNTFHEITRCIKLMHMDKLSMCMTMLKINGNILEMSSAGMPPVFIYRKNTSSVEEYMFKGMPLGTMAKFPYEIKKTELHSGDTIILMSDGFPELINDEKEMYGYKRARNIFEEIAAETPEEIITKLKNAGNSWINDKDPDDDVTFVVIKVK